MEPAEKATLLRAGLDAEGLDSAEIAQRLCLAIGYLTSQDKAKRETAKRRIREYIEIGKSKTGA
ncbi:MAG: hypothetical protein H3C26_12390 [Rhodocyclaceae bacterium]|nr:hypothetical protein [Rhodocyclaceae bacterium]